MKSVSMIGLVLLLLGILSFVVPIPRHENHGVKIGDTGFLLREGKYTAIDVPRSISTEPLAINDDGEIVGGYTDKQDNVHGFKAVPKE